LSDDLRTASDARALTRRRREARSDATIEHPANERAEVECPACGTSTEVTVLGDPHTAFPSFGDCWNWDCHAFLKFVWNGVDGADDNRDEAGQARLTAFGGGGQ
jgi:hypothetical protein